MLGGKPNIQVLGADGQIRLMPVTPPAAWPTPESETAVGGQTGVRPTEDYSGFTLELLTGGYAPQDLLPDEVKSAQPASATPLVRTSRGYSYALRPDAPRRFKTQVVSPDNEVTEEDCAQKFMLSSGEILRAIAAKVQVQRRTLEVFTHQVEMDFTNAAMDPDQAARVAYKVLIKNESFDARELRRALLRKLKTNLKELALDQADNDDQASHMLNVILCARPEILYQAQKAALATNCEVEQTEEGLPAVLEHDAPLPTSRLNVYRVMPPGLNSWERPFGMLP